MVTFQENQEYSVPSKTLEKLKKRGFILPRKESNTSLSLRNQFLALKHHTPTVYSLRRKGCTLWYLAGNEEEVFSFLCPSSFNIARPEQALSILAATDVDHTKLNELFHLLHNRAFLSLGDIATYLNCTKSMACIYAKTLSALSSFSYGFIGNKKYLSVHHLDKIKTLLIQPPSLESIAIPNFLSSLRKTLRFSMKDFSTLLGIDLNTYPHYEHGRHPPPKNIFSRIQNLLVNLASVGKRKAIFLVRMHHRLHDDLLLIRGIRLALELSTRQLTSLLGHVSDNLNDFERGFVSNSKNMQTKVINLLRRQAQQRKISWDKIMAISNAFKQTERERWQIAARYEKIVDLRIPRGGGVSFEQEIISLLKKQNFFDAIIANPLLANEEYTAKVEADIYALKHYTSFLCYDFIIECKSRKDRKSIGTKGMIGFARELLAKKQILGIKEAIIITNISFSKDLERHINALGVHIIHKQGVENFFHEQRFVDRKISAQES